MDIKSGKALPAQALYRFCDPQHLSFDTTESLEEFQEIHGRKRAFEAIRCSGGPGKFR